MTLKTQIDHDYKSLKYYFSKLFELYEGAIKEEQSFSMQVLDEGFIETHKTYHGFSQFIKPDMLLNIYSYLEFWLISICENQKKLKKLSLSYKDIRGDNDLHTYRKYLVKCAGIELKSVKNDYDRIQDLRKIRNYLVHHGGYVAHISVKEQEKIANIDGVSLSASLIIIEDDFVNKCLESANKFLRNASDI
ncbi:MAG: hypothetical protein ABJR05_03910 [Balneola sp.]